MGTRRAGPDSGDAIEDELTSTPGDDMPSQYDEDRQSQRAFDYSWNLFEACEGRQANYSKAKYAVSGILLAAIGALLTFIAQDGKNIRCGLPINDIGHMDGSARPRGALQI